ncbi:MAG: TrpB-like pyridoxal phosphate-dependent enzyme [Planctomycetota bacterium]|jgi:tryptophan synthase beta chain
MAQHKYVLGEDSLPRKWYNVLADMPNPPAPYLHPGTKQPVGPDDLSAIFPMDLIGQEVSTDRWIDIPDEVLEALALWRPTPLHRAWRLEKALETPAHIYYKNESISPPGSHKPNTSIAQAFYNKKAGIKRLTTETGAGQWGSALSFACNYFGLECMVYMVRVSYEQKPYRKSMMHSWGAEVVPSPSELTNAGRTILKEHPDSPGSLGMAISEAVEDAATHDDTNYSLGSVLNHVLLHQTVVGLEVKEQFEMAGEQPDILVGCTGGGSNFGGFIGPYLPDKLENPNIRIIAVEPCSCPTLTRGKFAYDFGDTGQMTPLIQMYTLGHDFVPPGIHAGGLRYHGMASIVSRLLEDGIIEAVAGHQLEVFDSAVLFARTEGIIPAPETAHAIWATIEEAKKCKETGEEKVIAFNLSGHGHFDMGAFDAYFADKLQDYAYPQEDIEKSMAKLPQV